MSLKHHPPPPACWSLVVFKTTVRGMVYSGLDVKYPPRPAYQWLASQPLTTERW